MYYETIAFRAAWLSVCQIPLILLLAMKTSLIGLLIGSSHERLNWAHRTVARCLLFTVTIHFSFFWREWWVYNAIESELETMKVVKFGLSAWLLLIWIVISSFAPIRNLRYEFFLVQHVVSFVGFVALVMLHVPPQAKVYVWIPVGVYAFDRVVRTGLLVWRNLRIWGEGKGRWRCKARLVALPGQATRITIEKPPLKNWMPGQHVFLSIPSISPLQSHPFTIASSPSSSTKELSFVVRAHAGFSRRVYDRATSLLPTTSSPAQEKSFTALIDGPYGSPPNFLQFDTLILIAGSTGATFTIPILLHVLQSQPNCVRRIQFVWIVKSGSNLDWFTNEIAMALDLAQERGIQLDFRGFVTCDPSYITNFPVRRRPSQRSCCCTEKVIDTATPANKTDADSISIVSESLNSSEEMGKCSCGVSELPVEVNGGRPDLRGILSRNFALARGETAVAVCGPEGLMARTGCLVAALSDERGANKGTGAYGITMYGEGFGW
jgi:ferric-chelate reductase